MQVPYILPSCVYVPVSKLKPLRTKLDNIEGKLLITYAETFMWAGLIYNGREKPC